MNENFQRLNIVKISFKKHGFRFLMPVVVILMTAFALSSKLILLLFIPMIILDLLSVKMKGLVDEITFENTSLSIEKGGQYKFQYKNLKAQPIKTYGHTKNGIKIYNKDNYTTIWEYEFSDADWEAINKKLSSLTTVQELDPTFRERLSSKK